METESQENIVVGDKTTFVGQFFEAVGHHILGGDLSRNENGDICLWRTETAVEVKSSGVQSSYGFRLSVEQIEHYERVSVFPFSRAWYMFFAYRNHSRKNGGGKRASELSLHTTPAAIRAYLADAIVWCLLVDLSIITRWRETRPHSTKSILGHLGAETVDLKCPYVHEFVNGGLADGLKGLNLDPASYGTLFGNVKATFQPDLFTEHLVHFPMTAVLPSSEIRSVQRMLSRRGFRLRQGVP